LPDELAEVFWDRGTAAPAGLPAPEEAEGVTLPAEERLGFHQGQSVAPGEQLREQNQRQSLGGVSAAGADLARDKAGQLETQGLILGAQRHCIAEEELEEAAEVPNQPAEGEEAPE